MRNGQCELETDEVGTRHWMMPGNDRVRMRNLMTNPNDERRTWMCDRSEGSMIR